MGMLRNFQPKQRLLAADLQEHKNRLAAVTPLSFSGNVEVSVSLDQGMHVHIPERPSFAPTALIRMKVKAVYTSGTNARFVRAVEYDGTTETGQQQWILKAMGHGVDEEIIAMRVKHGTPYDADDVGDIEGGNVEWIEWLYIEPTGTRYQPVQVVDDIGKLGIAPHRISG